MTSSKNSQPRCHHRVFDSYVMLTYLMNFLCGKTQNYEVNKWESKLIFLLWVKSVTECVCPDEKAVLNQGSQKIIVRIIVQMAIFF